MVKFKFEEVKVLGCSPSKNDVGKIKTFWEDVKDV